MKLTPADWTEYPNIVKKMKLPVRKLSQILSDRAQLLLPSWRNVPQPYWLAILFGRGEAVDMLLGIMLVTEVTKHTELNREE